MSAFAKELQAKDDRIAELENALEPFAIEAEFYAKCKDDRPAWMVIFSHAALSRTGLHNQHGGLSVKHFREAARVLNARHEEQK